jgi:hypothetical protein
MATWKFTDQYGTTYPALANSILSILVFDITGSSPVNGTAFTGTLDLTATGNAMNVLASLTGLTAIPFTGTVQEANNTLSVSLQSANDDVITKAVSANLPIIGKAVSNTGLSLANVTPASLTAQDEPTSDEIDINVTISIGKGTGTLVAQVPMSDGFFTVAASFQNVGIGLSDLDFLIPNGAFSAMFPAKELGPYYNSGTALDLLQLGITFYIGHSPLTVLPTSITVVVGIVNIPLYQQALYLDPLGVWVTVTGLNTTPAANWGLLGSLVLCNYNTPGKTDTPDFEFDFEMSFPNPPTENSFGISGHYQNPLNKPVSLMIQDLMGPGTDTGIANNITIEKFDFYTDADVTTGTITDFGIDIAMSGQFGLFQNFELEEFSISVAYSS